jgi:hypothetical protein
MSIFVFDPNTINMLSYILATQRFKEYSVGPQGLSDSLCALSLERVLIQTALKFPKFQKENASNIRILDVVRFLEQKNLINRAYADHLNEYVAFHDSLISTSAQITPQATGHEAQQILQFLCNEAGLNIDEELGKRTFEDIVALRAILSNEENLEVLESDFDNLNKLFEKCPSIQREIEKRLKVPLKRAEISGFTPNTGGIWLPFVTDKTPEKRGPFDHASIGVSFTPIDIRIGLNFGRQAHKYRIKYYELLMNGGLMHELESLSRKATGYCLCDTFWHYHVRNIQSLQWALTLYGSTTMAIERAIEETKHLEGNPLTAHRYLISKVISRQPEDFTYLVKGLIDEISKDLNELYPVLAMIDTLT